MFCPKWRILGLILPYFGVHFSRWPTNYLILVKEIKKWKWGMWSPRPWRSRLPSIFFQFAVFRKLLTENKMDMLSCTDYTYINVRLSCQVSGCSYDGPSYPPYNTGSFVRSAWRRPPDPNPNPNAMYGVTCAWMLWVVNWMWLAKVLGDQFFAKRRWGVHSL